MDIDVNFCHLSLLPSMYSIFINTKKNIIKEKHEKLIRSPLPSTNTLYVQIFLGLVPEPTVYSRVKGAHPCLCHQPLRLETLLHVLTCVTVAKKTSTDLYGKLIITRVYMACLPSTHCFQNGLIRRKCIPDIGKVIPVNNES